MKNEDLALVEEFLLSNWYDREETDEYILREFVLENDPGYLKQVLAALKEFLSDKHVPDKLKSLLIEKTVWKLFNDSHPSIEWLSSMTNELETILRKNSENK